jgi:hypothetical protein
VWVEMRRNAYSLKPGFSWSTTSRRQLLPGNKVTVIVRVLWGSFWTRTNRPVRRHPRRRSCSIPASSHFDPGRDRRCGCGPRTNRPRNQGQLSAVDSVYREWAASRPGTVKVSASRADASRPWVATQGLALLTEPVKTSDFGYYKGGKAQRRARKIADRVDRGRASFETAAFAASSG